MKNKVSKSLVSIRQLLLHHLLNGGVIFVFSCSFANSVFSQAILNADGLGNTYELINSVLAPGAEAVESPECVHPEFGRHIAEVWDADLNQYVFEFYSHVRPDNDRCINFDRQRVEIKTYDPSPDSLKGTRRETIIYKWKFKIPSGFQPSTSFTHIHQIKAVGGDEDSPIFTLTARKASPNRLELIHNNTTKLATANLSLFENTWVEATETVMVDSLHGTYSMIIKKVSDGTTILSYSNTNLMTIRYNNNFIRPKWGIYRSLLDSTSLRDDAIRFNNFSIYEVPGPKPQSITFPSFPIKNLGNDDFFAGAWADSNLPISYTSSNPSVATIVNNKIHLVGFGTSTITASQKGDANFQSADDVSQRLIVSNYNLTLNPIADSYIHGANPTINYGTLPVLQIKENGTASFTRKSFLKFDLTGAGFDSIFGAKVRLYSTGHTAGLSSPISMASCNDNWNESEITYTNVPTIGNVLNTVKVETDSIYYEWDVTAYVKTCLTNSTPVSVVIYNSLASNNLTKFNSREALTNLPELILSGISSESAISEFSPSKDLLRVSPNPVSDQANLEYTISQNTIIKAVICQANGQVVKSIITNEHQSEGVYRQAIRVSDLANGVYFIQFSSINFCKTVKLIVRR